MAVLMRLTGCQMSSHLMNLERHGVLTLSRSVTLKPIPTKLASTADYDERNMKLGRPQSPHLTIYAPQLTSMLSITHRMTGAALAGVTMSIGLSALVLPQPLSHYVEAIQGLELGTPLLVAAKVVLAFPFAYHICNGVRHLCWDLGMFLTLKEVYGTGYVMLVCAAATAVGLISL